MLCAALFDIALSACDEALPRTVVVPVAGQGDNDVADAGAGVAGKGTGTGTGTGDADEADAGPIAEMFLVEPRSRSRVLWSQQWAVQVHSPVAYGASEGARMGLSFEAGGQSCLFGLEPARSGSTQRYATGLSCITERFEQGGGAVSRAYFFDKEGNPNGYAPAAAIEGLAEALKGHTLMYLSRTQSYKIELRQSAGQRWNYADFYGKWEAVGY